MDILPRETSAEDSALDASGSKVLAVVVCNIVLIVASTLGLLVRFFVRIRYLNGISWDDAFCAIGWVFTFVECFVCILMTRYGYGRHIDVIHDESKLVMFMKLDFVTELTYLLALGAIKLSFCLFYLKIFPGKALRICCWSLIGLLVAETTEEIFVVIFQCWPVNKAWDTSVKGKCLSLIGFYYISFGIRLVTDIALFALPIPKLTSLNMTIGKRIGVVVMFGLGILVVTTSIIRATYLGNLSSDRTWSLVDTLNWSSVELGVSIIIACFPSFKALVTFRFPQLRRILGLSSNRSDAERYGMYGVSGRRGEGQTGHRSLHNTRLSHLTTHTKTEVEVSRDGSEEHIIPFELHPGIQVTTDVSVDRMAKTPRKDRDWDY